jgi:hypothetical protein
LTKNVFFVNFTLKSKYQPFSFSKFHDTVGKSFAEVCHDGITGEKGFTNEGRASIVQVREFSGVEFLNKFAFSVQRGWKKSIEKGPGTVFNQEK